MTTPTNADTLAKLRTLLDDGTPGPWHASPGATVLSTGRLSRRDRPVAIAKCHARPEMDANARKIVASVALAGPSLRLAEAVLRIYGEPHAYEEGMGVCKHKGLDGSMCLLSSRQIVHSDELRAYLAVAEEVTRGD